MGLRTTIASLFSPAPGRDRPAEAREYLPWVTFNGNQYPLGLQQTLVGNKEEIGRDFAGLAYGVLKSNPVAFACCQARAALFSEARFMYRHLRSGTPGELWSQPELDLLRVPWPGGTTGDLLARTMQDNDLSGNAFWLRGVGRLIRLRPDWVTIAYSGSDMWDPDSEVIGYLYQPGGTAGGRKPIAYNVEQVAHFAPIPDPLAPHRGMSWLTSLLREVAADSTMTTFKSAYLENGATPNLVVTGVPSASQASFKEWVDAFELKHKGAANAYRSLYLSASMDAKVIGSDMGSTGVDFKSVQGLGETRIAAAAGVPAAVVGISEGLAGSSLNAGNFAASMRRFADLTMRPLWRNACGSFAQIIDVPGESELWYDDRDVAALKDDIMSAAEVQAKQAQAIRQYVDAGFEPDSVVNAVNAGDLKRLTHTGLFSVQLQPPMPEQPEPEPEAEPEPEPDDNPDDENVPDGGDTE